MGTDSIPGLKKQLEAALEAEVKSSDKVCNLKKRLREAIDENLPELPEGWRWVQCYGWKAHLRLQSGYQEVCVESGRLVIRGLIGSAADKSAPIEVVSKVLEVAFWSTEV